ncbi:histidinol-phosphate transaminase [Thiomicrorhabdus sediminis]|uniref:Histidinol-phosphate aminotransferase n=1 Tax=Thiomicrorhabdus sediminis TaxID=2580412 RepID=A0A4P9K702_9GAMM|nr:histidinol-phosphate transaminase [Thiomicrorhabdus sediminis]QCU90106.1 histidinol-phosphate transaminase [Thiomicrorhabdus sediminis]
MSQKTTDFSQRLQPQIAAIHPYVPGKPVSELQRELGLQSVVKLASNENPLGCSEQVKQSISAQLTEVARYPDGGCYQLKAALAEFLQLKSSQIAIGNGSNELLELVARVFAGPGDEIVFSQYGFAVYPISAQVVGAKGIEVAAQDYGHDLDAVLAAISDKTKVIYLANANNPTGTYFDKQTWQRFIAQVPSHIIVVLDEAYIEYARSFVEQDRFFDGTDYLSDYANLLVSRTFSKAYGLAALRVGYMAGCEEIIGYINQVREPFNVNQMAQVAALAALNDQTFVAESVKQNFLGMRQLTQAFADLGLDYIPSVGNFICVNVGDDAAKLNQQLLQQGVIVRPVANYGMAGYLRISVGSQIENDFFIDVLKGLLN